MLRSPFEPDVRLRAAFIDMPIVFRQRQDTAAATMTAMAESVPKVDRAAAFDSYIPAATTLPELSVLPLVIGTVLGVIFGASSLYLVLKVGLTVSASIP